MSVDSISSTSPSGIMQTTSTSQTDSVAMTSGDFSGLTPLWQIAKLSISISTTLNSATSGPFQAMITGIQHQEYLDQAWESAINDAISAEGSGADGSTQVTIPKSVTLADGSTSYLYQYLAERPSLQNNFMSNPDTSAPIDVSQMNAVITQFSQSSIGSSDYGSMVDYIVYQLTTYGDPSQLPQPAPPPIQAGQYPNNAPLPQEYVDYVNKLAALFTSENIMNNPDFLNQGDYYVTIDNSKNLISDINTSATNFGTALQQITNTLNNLVAALNTFSAAMAQCIKNTQKAPNF